MEKVSTVSVMLQDAITNLFSDWPDAKDMLLIPTQIKLRIPLGHYGRLASKSGLAILHHLHVGAGVIDPDYTGEIKVLLTN